jgi:origin recognition complex subunit 1
MDELDQLVTKNQSVMYNFFNWPALRHSRLVVLAVANTMDLPERTLSNKISSRIGLTRITFSGYKHQELMKIIESRLENVPGNVVDSDAIQFASRKVAAVSGDARRALDICRRAVEIAESASSAVVKAKGDVAVWEGEGTHGIDPMTSTPTKSRTRGRKVSQHGQTESTGTDRALVIHRVTISTIKQAIQEATSTPFQQTLRCLSFPGKVFLSGLLARIRRTGLAESSLGDILDEAKRITMSAGAVTSAAISGPKAFLLNSHKNRMAGMGVALIELANAGILAVEGDLSGRDGRKGFVHAPGTGNRSGMVKLRIATEDVRASFRDDAEAKILGLGVDS